MNKKSVLFCTIFAVSISVLQGCTFAVNPYGASVENVYKLKTFETKIATENFTSNKPGINTITCRGAGPVSTPNKEPFESYIYQAFVSELKLAGLHDDSSTVKLTGTFKNIDFSSAVGNGRWFFVIDLKSNNGKSIEVNSTYNFSTNWVGDKACQQVAQAFGPAVQKFIGDVINHPDFRTLLQ